MYNFVKSWVPMGPLVHCFHLALPQFFHSDLVNIKGNIMQTFLVDMYQQE